MARIFPFQAYRYSPQAGPLENLVTQPYDKITPPMQARYLELSPYNAVRIILGPRFAQDSAADNVYTRAREYLHEWIQKGVLEREPSPCLYAYFQEFLVPETGERAVRQGFIGLGAVEDYSQGVVHRHEQTLRGPKQDRLELLRHTRAHLGHIFMLYPDPRAEIDALLAQASQGQPLACVIDEYQATHRLWRIAEPDHVARIQQLMADKKLLIADGHHRYETALAFRNEHPELPDAHKVMMTFVNLHSPGLRILATHRLVQGLPAFRPEDFLRRAAEVSFQVRPIASVESLGKAWAQQHAGLVQIGAAFHGSGSIYLLETGRPEGELDLKVLHQKLIGEALGISEEAVREERNLRYMRGLEAAVEEVQRGAAQIAFLLQPTPIEQVARIAFAGGVMPQKSTDFYPKLLSGLTIYRLERLNEAAERRTLAPGTIWQGNCDVADRRSSCDVLDLGDDREPGAARVALKPPSGMSPRQPRRMSGYGRLRLHTAPVRRLRRDSQLRWGPGDAWRDGGFIHDARRDHEASAPRTGPRG